VPGPDASQARLQRESGRLYLSGILDQNTVAGLYADGRNRIREAAGNPLILDLSRLNNSDTSGLALLVDWWRTARGNSVQLQFYGVPRQLREIARVCGLGDFLDSKTHAP